MSEDPEQSHTMWDGDGMDQSLNNTIQNAVINDVFLNDRVNNTITEEQTGNDFITKTIKKNIKRRRLQIGNTGVILDQSDTEDTIQNRRLIVIIKGTTENIVDKNELKLKRCFLSIDSNITANNIKLHRDYITIALDNQSQVDKFKSIRDILESAVEVTEHKSNKFQNATKLIIFGVPLTWTEEEIQTETGAAEVHRLQKFNFDTKTKEPTTSVILTFQTLESQNQVYIG